MLLKSQRQTKKSATVAIGSAKLFEKDHLGAQDMSAIIDSGSSYELSLSEDYVEGNVKFTFDLGEGKTKETYI